MHNRPTSEATDDGIKERTNYTTRETDFVTNAKIMCGLTHIWLDFTWRATAF